MTRNTATRRVIRIAALAASTLALAACAEYPTLFNNPDPELRKTNAEFAADADARFPYKADASRGAEPKCRAQAAYSLNRLEIVQFTEDDWANVEVWVNRQYVCFVPKMQSRQLKEVHFPMLYNALGQTFPMDNSKIIVHTVEVYRNGKMYDVVVHNADY